MRLDNPRLCDLADPDGSGYDLRYARLVCGEPREVAVSGGEVAKPAGREFPDLTPDVKAERVATAMRGDRKPRGCNCGGRREN